jgi:hypothetical protein
MSPMTPRTSNFNDKPLKRANFKEELPALNTSIEKGATIAIGDESIL